ncbi:MAG: hypothetical protein ACPG4Y_05200 [Chitinophagales bacterium]
MPSIATKIAHSTLLEVKLYKEGVFWVAYEQSAYFIAQLKNYKPTKKYFKNINQEVVQIGFPSIETLLQTQGIKVLNNEANFVCFNIDNAIETPKFTEWKDSIASTQPKAKIVNTTTSKLTNNTLEQKILNFDVSNKTPMQAIIFINQLKNNITNGNLQ